MDVNVSAMFSMISELSHDPAFNGNVLLQFPISPLASHVAFYVGIMLYLYEELKSAFRIDDKLAGLGCIAV